MPPEPPSQKPRVLVLWDIDHTLIETRGMGFTIYQRAFKEATGRDLDKLAKISGRTELDIAAETLRMNGIVPTTEAVQRLSAELVRGYDKARHELATNGRLLPGAKEVLAHLDATRAVHQSVLTGNLREIAHIKLAAFGIDELLHLSSGAYGEDSHDRTALVGHAQSRASEFCGVHFSSGMTILVGDTLNDIRAGINSGARVIGVATGQYTESELHQAGADATVPDLTNVQLMASLMI